MNSKSGQPKSGAKLPRAAGAGPLILVLGGALGCTAYSTLKSVPVPIDCSVEDAYEFQSINTFEMPGATPMWTTADCTTGSSMTAAEVALPDGARCGSTAALEIQASHNNNWGSLTGYNDFGPLNGSAYEGLSFWARAPGNSNRGFSVLLDDPNTSIDMGVTPQIGNCTSYQTADAGACGTLAGSTVVDPATGMVLSSGTLTAPPLPNACGNSYSTVMLVTADWQLYTIPFGRFQQGETPNHVPNNQLTETGSVPGTTLITSQLLNLTLRMPKAVDMDLWIDNLAFYRKKGTGGDGGVDAP